MEIEKITYGQVFLLILEWIYCDEIEGLGKQDGGILEDLLEAADHLKLQDLVILVQKSLVDGLTVNNVVRRAKMIKKISLKECKELEKGIVKYMARNLDQVFKREDVMEIPTEIFYQVCKTNQ